MSKIYKLKRKLAFYDSLDDEYIVMEELNHLVALVNIRTNAVTWVTRHILGLEFKPKTREAGDE